MEEAERIGHSIRSLAAGLKESRLEIHGEEITRPPMERKTSDTERLFDLAQRCGRTNRNRFERRPNRRGASDGNFTAALGIPTLDGLGAIGGGAHAVDEWVDIESLPARGGTDCRVD